MQGGRFSITWLQLPKKPKDIVPQYHASFQIGPHHKLNRKYFEIIADVVLCLITYIFFFCCVQKMDVFAVTKPTQVFWTLAEQTAIQSNCVFFLA